MKQITWRVFCAALGAFMLMITAACASGQSTTSMTTTAKTTAATTMTATKAKTVEKSIVYQIRNDSNKDWMLDSSAKAGYYDDLDAFDASDYTVAPGATVRTGVDVAKRLASGELIEKSATTYELMVICAAGPLPEDPKESYVYIEDVTLIPVKVNGTYGTEPIIVWDGNTFKQLTP